MTEQRHSALGLHPVELDAGDAPVELLKRRQIVRRTKIAAVIVLVLLAAGAGRTMLSRLANARALEAGATENAKQYVRTTRAKRSGAGQSLALPGLSATQTLFDNGRVKANVEFARAGHAGAIANYRRVVLVFNCVN